MRKILFVVVGFLAAGSAAWALISSYGYVTGSVTVNQAIGWDILESYSDVNNTLTNDTTYVLETTYQGETKWVKLKIINNADVSLPVNLTISGATADVDITMWNENKTSALQNPLDIPTADLYMWLKHQFANSAAPGTYNFIIDIAPA